MLRTARTRGSSTPTSHDFVKTGVDLLVERLLTDHAMRAEIFRGTAAELAAALAAVGHLGATQGAMYGGFFGWNGT